MKLVPYTYNGHALNDGTLTSWIDRDASPSYGADAQMVDRSPGVFPKLASKKLSDRVIPVNIYINTDPQTVSGTVFAWFDPRDQTEREFICQDTANANKPYYVMATSLGVPKWGGRHMVASLQVSDPVWRSSTEYSGTITVGTTDVSGTVTVGGLLSTEPTIELTPSAAGGTVYASKMYSIVYPKSTKAYVKYPVDITSATWDTATLISGTALQADGDDIRVTDNGVEIPFWLNGLNSGTTSVWCNLDLQPTLEVTLAGSVVASGTVAYLDIKRSDTHASRLKKWNAAGFCLIGNEAFYYGSMKLTSKSYRLNAIQRAQLGTSEAGHAAADTVRYIEHEVCILYNNPEAEEFEQDDTNKPMLDLANSSNTEWAWTEFTDLAGLRTAAWKPSTVKTLNKSDAAHYSGVYYGEHGTVDADPSTVAGMVMRAWKYGNSWKGENADMNWQIDLPAGGTAYSVTSEVYRYSTTFPTAKFERYYKGDWRDVYTQATPGSASTWMSGTAFTGAAFGGTYYDFRFRLVGALGASADNEVAWEIDTCSIKLDSTLTPVVALSSGASNYQINSKVTNVTSGDYIGLSYPMATGQTLAIDCEDKAVTLDGVNALPALSLSSVRRGWFDLSPGANVIQYEDSGAGTISMVVKWREREAG